MQISYDEGVAIHIGPNNRAKRKVGLRNNELLFAFVDIEEIMAHPLRW